MASEMKEAIMMDIVLSVTSNHANDWANEMYNPQTFAQVPKSFFYFTLPLVQLIITRKYNLQYKVIALD